VENVPKHVTNQLWSKLRELKQFDHTIITAQPKQHAITRPAAANAARLLLDIISRRA